MPMTFVNIFIILLSLSASTSTWRVKYSRTSWSISWKCKVSYSSHGTIKQIFKNIMTPSCSSSTRLSKATEYMSKFRWQSSSPSLGHLSEHLPKNIFRIKLFKWVMPHTLLLSQKFFLRTTSIIDSFFIIITQSDISLRNTFEGFLCFWGRIFIRMNFQWLLFVSLFYFFSWCCLFNSQ